MSASLALPAPARRPRRDQREVAAALALCFALSAAVQGTVLLTPLLTMHVFDGVLESRNYATLVVLTVGFALALALGGVLRLLRAALLARIAEGLGRKLQLRALAASVRVALGGDTTRPATALGDLAELRRLLGGPALADLLDLLSVPVALGFLWLMHPLFLLVGIVAVAVKAGLAVAADRATRADVAAATAQAARAKAELGAALRQPDAVRGLGMTRGVLRGWLPLWLDALEREDRAQRRVRALGGLLMLAEFAQQMAIVTAGAWLLIRQDATPGVMLAATMMIGFATNPVVALVARWRDWAFGRLAWRRLHALAEAGCAPAVAPRDASAPEGVVFDGITVCIPGSGRVLVRDLSLRLAPGEAWLLIGPNGIGKTSLLRAALGLAEPASGRVLLDGQDTFRADRATLGPRLGYLPQEPGLLEGSVLDNIARFGGGGPEGAVEAARRLGAHDGFGRLHRGYETPAGPGGGLSGGQSRLVALARALHGTPRLLVLDEPEAGLDAAARGELRGAVVAAREAGAVVLLVTHEPAAWAGAVDGALRLGGDGGWAAERDPERAA